MRVLLKRGEERAKGENVGVGAGAVSAPSNRERRLQEVGDDKRTPPGSEREEGEERWISSFFFKQIFKASFKWNMNSKLFC